MNIYHYYNKPQELDRFDDRFNISPSAALGYALAELIDVPDKVLTTIARNARTSFKWALYTNKPFKQGEAIISKSPQFSYLYAKDVIGGRWELGEDSIATDPKYASEYAVKVLKGPFKKGESVIKSDKAAHEYYLSHI